MSTRIPGLLPAPNAALRKPEPARDRPASPLEQERAASPSLPAPTVTDTWQPAVDPVPERAPGGGSGSGAPADDATAVAEALQAADRVRQAALAAPGQAGRAHANLVPATVLNLLA